MLFEPLNNNNLFLSSKALAKLSTPADSALSATGFWRPKLYINTQEFWNASNAAVRNVKQSCSLGKEIPVVNLSNIQVTELFTRNLSLYINANTKYNEKY